VTPPAADTVVVRGGYVLTMGPQGGIRNGAVAFDQTAGRILAVGRFSDIEHEFSDAAIVGEQDDIIVPGFVNGHDHLSEALICGLAETMNLYEWIERLIRPVGPHLTAEMARVGTLLKGIEMISAGITTVNDMFVHANPGSLASLGVVEGLEALGMRGVVSFGAEDLPGHQSIEGLLEEHHALAHRASNTDLVGFRIGMSTIQSQSDELFAASISLARQHGWQIHTHLAEVTDEITESRLRFGTNTLGRAHAAGLLEVGAVFAHCVWVNEPDVAMLAGSKCSVVHNPISNMILGSGICPVPRLRAAGIPVGLGTDGAASNDSHDMLQAIKVSALIQKMTHLDPTVMTAVDSLTMATIEGARALGLDRDIGSLEPGKRADIVRFRADGPRLAYVHDPYQALVYCAGSDDISDVWIDGHHVLENKVLQTVRESAVLAEAQRLAKELFSLAGLHSLVDPAFNQIDPDFATSNLHHGGTT
jgi:5-methylthioadenosine/S-adenosylhomocysteine deaminase